MIHNNKTFLVIGGAKKGVGEAITQNLLKHNVRIVIVYQKEDAENAEILSKKFKNRLKVYEIDYSNRKSIIKFCEEFSSALDGIVYSDMFFEMENIQNPDYELWDRSVSINLTAPNIFIHELKNKLKDGSSIVIITSTEGFIGSFGSSAYSMTKAAIHNLIKTFANNLGARNIRINAIAAGWIGGVMDTDEVFNLSRSITPLKRLGKPSEIANVVYFLLTSASSFITGTTITADGGYTCVDSISKFEFKSAAKV